MGNWLLDYNPSLYKDVFWPQSGCAGPNNQKKGEFHRKHKEKQPWGDVLEEEKSGLKTHIGWTTPWNRRTEKTLCYWWEIQPINRKVSLMVIV